MADLLPGVQHVYMAIREVYFRLWNKTVLADDGRRALCRSLGNTLNWRPQDLTLDSKPQPYTDLGQAAVSETSQRSDLLFISARFRSGSTLLWNLFRRIPGCVSYYEPLNERKWFNPKTRGERVDQTHREVDVYWKEYEGLECLEDVWDDQWPEHRLYMSADAWDPRLKRYIEILCERAAGRPVLQFNRVDFRLPWLRATFPNAKLLHLYRHPRDQWMSVMKTKQGFSSQGHMRDFAGSDYFYTRPWAEDLKYQFPFLDERNVQHPYELHYFLWKLSYLYGRAFSHCSIGFEELSLNPEKTLFELLSVCGIDAGHIESLLPIIQPPAFGKWKEYADNAWFSKYETKCETTLAEFLAKQAVVEPLRNNSLVSI